MIWDFTSSLEAAIIVVALGERRDNIYVENLMMRKLILCGSVINHLFCYEKGATKQIKSFCMSYKRSPLTSFS